MRRGTTLVELMVMLVITVIMLGTLFVIWQSSRTQERHLGRFVELQQGLRGVTAQIQHDLREVAEVIELEREGDGTLKSLEIRVPSFSGDSMDTVSYSFESGIANKPGTLRRQRSRRVTLEDALVDLQIFPFTMDDPIGPQGRPTDPLREEGIGRRAIDVPEAGLRAGTANQSGTGSGAPTASGRPRLVTQTLEFDRIHLFKVRLTFVPGTQEFLTAGAQRTYSFSVYPRISNARRKSIMSRFNLITGRFGRPATVWTPPETAPDPE